VIAPSHYHTNLSRAVAHHTAKKEENSRGIQRFPDFRSAQSEHGGNSEKSHLRRAERKGKLLDEFNSRPDYFDFGGQVPATSRGGQPGILLRFCLAGVSEDDLSQILSAGNVLTEEMIDKLCNQETCDAAMETLRTNSVAAEDLIAQLAEKMGISSERAVADYRGGGA
jgi:hypothetical protein